MRIGMFGGSFDPVHVGHLILAESCREQAQLDQVWFIPSAMSPNKPGGPIATDRQRLETLRLATGGHSAFHVSEIETKRGGVSFTVDTLSEIQKLHPAAELFLLIGGDSFNQFHTWRTPEKICELATPLIMARPGDRTVDFDKLESLVSKERLEYFKQFKIECPLIEISSTEIRRRCGAGESIRFRTPRAVEKYLETQKMYLSDLKD